MVSVSVNSEIVGTSPGSLSDEELYKKLKEKLKDYIEKQLDAKRIEIRETGKPDISLSNIEKIADTPLASVVASYMSFIHQEKQDQTNTKLQRYILLVAFISAVTSVSSVIVACLKH